MSIRWKMLGAVGSALTLVSCSPAASPQPSPRGELAQAAAAAARAGRTAATIQTIFCENGSASSLDEILTHWSVMVVEAAGVSVQTTDDNSIYTWHAFRRVNTMSHRQPPPDTCLIGLPPPKLKSFDTAIPLVAGTSTIDGVRVTMNTPHATIKFDKGERYLLIGNSCPGGTFVLPQGQLDVFNINEFGWITASQGSTSFPFVRDVLKLDTVEELAAVIKTL